MRTLTDLLDQLLTPWRIEPETRFLVRQHGRRLNTMEDRMTSFDDQLTRGGQIVGLLRAEFASLRQQVTDLGGRLDAEEADDQAQVAAARQADADRVGGLIDELASVLGATGEVPTPAPGEPATDPETGTTSDDVVGGGTPDVHGGVGDGNDSSTHADDPAF